MVQLTTVALIVYGVYRISELELSMGGLIAVIMLSSRAVAPMGQIANLITQFEQTRTAYRNLDELMKKPVERPETGTWVRRPKFEGGIGFRQVGFSYPEAVKASLSDASFRIRPGEHVGIIGKVGSGKTTLVNQLPQGFDTLVGEQGGFLSGGQRQSIALGRALLLDEPILLLDEPTNSFDNTTESIVRKRLFDYTRDKTLVLVTHKASMLDLVERLIVVDEGRIVMDGPKQQVLDALKGGQHGQG